MLLTESIQTLVLATQFAMLSRSSQSILRKGLMQTQITSQINEAASEESLHSTLLGHQDAAVALVEKTQRLEFRLKAS